MKLQTNISNKLSITLFLAILFCFAALTAAAQEKIVFDSQDEIYIMNADGTGQIRLTDNIGRDQQPAFSPDGSKIAFVSNRDGNDEIYVMNVDGSDQTRLTNNAAVDANPAFSGDGSKIAFHSNRNGNYEIYLMSADGSDQINLTNNPANDFSPSFSQSTNKIAFASVRDDVNETGNFEIYVMEANGASVTRLTFNQAYDDRPSFSPDGSKIAFHSRTNQTGFEIFVMNANGTNPINLTNNTASVDFAPAFSPDGSKIVFSSFRNSMSDLYTVNVNGSGLNRLTNDGGKTYSSWGVRANNAPTITAFGATLARDSAADLSIASVTDAEDAEDALNVTVNGSSSATVSGVTLSGIAVSPAGNVTANLAAGCGAANATFTLRVTDSGALFNEATLNVTVTAETIAPTLSLPADIVTSLPLNSTDTSKIVNFTVSATDNCDAAPSVSAVPPSGSAFPVGTTAVNVTATDASGNTATGSFTVTVLYNFAGFFQPIDNLPTVNLASAGQSVPVKFSLSGDKGLNIFAAGYPASQPIACIGGLPSSTIDETATAGASSLSYDATTDRYIYVWKTEKAWKGTCRQLTVKLNDGSMHTAYFQFK